MDNFTARVVMLLLLLIITSYLIFFLNKFAPYAFKLKDIMTVDKNDDVLQTIVTHDKSDDIVMESIEGGEEGIKEVESETPKGQTIIR